MAMHTLIQKGIEELRIVRRNGQVLGKIVRNDECYGLHDNPDRSLGGLPGCELHGL
jgi:hypothetical protein